MLMTGFSCSYTRLLLFAIQVCLCLSVATSSPYSPCSVFPVVRLLSRTPREDGKAAALQGQLAAFQAAIGGLHFQARGSQHPRQLRERIEPERVVELRPRAVGIDHQAVH